MKNAYRWVALLAACLMLLTAIPFAAAEGPRLAITADKTTVNPGDRVKVSFVSSGITAESGWEMLEFTIGYDPAQLTPQGYTSGSGADSAAMMDVNFNENPLRGAVISTTTQTGNGEIISVEFLVSDTVAPGTAINLNVQLLEFTRLVVENQRVVGFTPLQAAGGYPIGLTVAAPSVQITFKGKYNETVAVKTASSAEELETLLRGVTAPALGGYAFIGWSESADEAPILFDMAMQGDRTMFVTAVYEQEASAKSYHLVGLENMTARDGAGNEVTSSTMLGFDQRITVTAAGDVAYWILDGAKVGFGRRSYTFYVSGNNRIAVVLAVDAQPVEPAVVLQQVTWAKGSEGFTLSVIAQTSIPTGSTVTEYGVIFAAKTATLESLRDTGTASGAVQRVKSTKTGANQQYMAHLLSVKANRERSAIAYAVIDGQTIYSDGIAHFQTATDTAQAQILRSDNGEPIGQYDDGVEDPFDD